MSIINNVYFSSNYENLNLKKSSVFTDKFECIEIDPEKFSKIILNDYSIRFDKKLNTSIIYQVVNGNGKSLNDNYIKEINSFDGSHESKNEILKLTEMGYELKFLEFEDPQFQLNLQVIESNLHELIAHIVKDQHLTGIVKFNEIIEKLRIDNPMDYDLRQGHKFYEYRLVNFLVEAAMGMTSKKVWSGNYDIVGGIIIVKPDTDILCYHLIDFNKFKKYLKNSARLDNPSGSKMGYGEIYKNENGSFIKLNFQVKA